MKTSMLLLPLSGLAMAAPAVKRQNVDPLVLQFALTLEHLENVFYKEALGNFTEAQFLAAGYSASYYRNTRYIASDEQAHVQLLTTALRAAGATPVAACSYNFKFTDVKSFVTLSSILEGVGTSAYLGGAPLITSKDYLTVAGSILVTEALHTSIQRAAIALVPAANPYGTPLGPRQVFSLASAFITACPSTNQALPFTPFPKLASDTTKPGISGRQQFFRAASTVPSGSYATFINGLSVISKTITVRSDGKISAVVPSNFGGQTYVVVTNRNVTGSTLADSDVLFGPAIIEVLPPAPQIDNSVL